MAKENVSLTRRRMLIRLEEAPWVFLTMEVSKCFSSVTWFQNLYCETQPPASIGWVALSSVVCLFVRRRPASVTSPLISTIWCFWAYKPYIFCEDMILATCQCQHIFCCWVEPSLLLSSCNQAPTSTRGYSTTRFSNHYSYPTRKILLLDRVVE